MPLAKWLVDMDVPAYELDVGGITLLQQFACTEQHIWRTEDSNSCKAIEEMYRYLRSLTPEEDINEVFLGSRETQWRQFDQDSQSHQTLLSAAIEARNWPLVNLLSKDGARCSAKKMNDLEWLRANLAQACESGHKTTYSQFLYSVPRDLVQDLLIIDGDFIEKKCNGKAARGSLDNCLSIFAMVSESGGCAEPSALERAIRIGSPTQIVRALLSFHPELDMDGQPPDTKWSALHLAINYYCVDAARVLLEFGIDPNFHSEYRTTTGRGPFSHVPLIRAVCRAHYIGKNDVVVALLEHGADVNARVNVDRYSDRSYFDIPESATALVAAFRDVDVRRAHYYTRCAHIRWDSIRSITHKAVHDRLPAELTDVIADQLIADLTSDSQSRDLIKILIKYGADPTGVANGAKLSKISEFVGGYEELWDDHLRLGIEEGQRTDLRI